MAKRKKQLPPETYQHFIFGITDWTPEYSFGVNPTKHRDDLYSEYAELTVEAKCVFPPQHSDIAAQFQLVGDRNCHTPTILEYEKDWKPRCIGALELRGERFYFYCSLPYDALWGVSAMIVTGKYRYILLYGYSLKRRKSLIQSIYFQNTVDLEEY